MKNLGTETKEFWVRDDESEPVFPALFWLPEPEPETEKWAKLAQGCEDLGWAFSHPYSERTCSECGQIFCWNCCGNTNHHEGGKYSADFMLCPKCGHDCDQD